ncbi:cytochrome c assembly protein [Acidimicrobium ferrooxidans DSM 10331]|uniref:Heme exporter protein C n=1 Tax=Acidimicrobium ferrooxidans (strain DSM 10331 / JCM 15462 / NBRC 103882 / ICP) TaxID=525909 RepID=C7M2Q8_ACIFD|nr:cytochrome c biogenesis protein CcsA [Acidimicrobium ferrooxidans]ACU53302.1 cytochrome c assembly protein [Acidimicrobium ferrooxidans DSM 10331]
MRQRASMVRRVVGLGALAGVALTAWLGLVATPPAEFFGNLVRLLYVHPSMAWVAFLAFGVTTLASALYLWPRTRRPEWDLLAAASAEAGVVFTGLTLVTGSIWGRPTWGVWWTWDALLTATAVLFLLYLGYLALRRIPMDEERRAKRSAIWALIAFIDVPIVNQSVYWWHTLHQRPTLTVGPTNAVEVHGIMAVALAVSFVSFTLVWIWMVWARFDLARRQRVLEEAEVEQALAERLEAVEAGS